RRNSNLAPRWSSGFSGCGGRKPAKAGTPTKARPPATAPLLPGQVGARVRRVEAGELLDQFAAAVVLRPRDDDLRLDVLVPALDTLAAEAQAGAARRPPRGLPPHAPAVPPRHA